MHKTTGGALLALLLLGSLLSACVTGRSGDEPGGAPYVALGDSYTAAPGIGAGDGDDGCLRSTNNYPHLVAEQTGLELDDVSCSGATTGDITDPQSTSSGEVDAQLQAVGEDTETVSIGIGFNNASFAARLFVTCPALAADDPTGAPCRTADAIAGDDSSATVTERLVDDVTSILRRIRDRAPDAQVIVVGYPSIFPPDTACTLLPLAAGDVAFARSVIVRINDALERAAGSEGATYVDTFTPTEGHDICSEDPWVAGALVPDGSAGAAWHPYATEQQVVATLVAEAID